MKKYSLTEQRKKNQKYKKKQIKKLERQGLAPDEIKKQIQEIMNKRKNDTALVEEGLDINNYEVEELIDRPRVSR